MFGICQRILYQKIIKVEPISSEEAWTLFMDKLGHDTLLALEVEQIEKFVAGAGLPLGIITMAGTMRGVVDICEWRNALHELKESKVRKEDMEPKVFYILRFNYTHLSDSDLQRCFLYCAVFPEDFMIPRKVLVRYLIDERVIKGFNSRVVELDNGRSMLNRLENVCLLEGAKMYGDRSCVKMHDLIREMAIQILQENSQIIAKAGAQLKELPDAEEWTENLTRVSLTHNQIKEIPFSHSPRKFNCSGCKSMKKLFPLGLLPNLVNLEEIRVMHYEKMEKIIGTTDDEKSSISPYSITKFILPKLRILRLRYLLELKSISSAKLVCDSVERIDVWECQKLKRIPLCIPLLENSRPSPPPSLRRKIIHPKQW
ncbi:hypothetical protein Peur_024640 [Populus x canadensis]